MPGATLQGPTPGSPGTLGVISVLDSFHPISLEADPVWTLHYKVLQPWK